MPLQIQGSINIDAPRERVYPRLFEPELWRKLIGQIPGVSLERFERVNETEYHATALLSASMVTGRYDGKINVLESKPCESARLKIEGLGGGNQMHGEVMITLRPVAGRTMLDYQGQGNLTGPLAPVGQTLVDTVARQFIEQGAQALAHELGEPRSANPAPPPARSWLSHPVLNRIQPAVAVIFLLIVLALILVWLAVTLR